MLHHDILLEYRYVQSLKEFFVPGSRDYQNEYIKSFQEYMTTIFSQYIYKTTIENILCHINPLLNYGKNKLNG